MKIRFEALELGLISGVALDAARVQHGLALHRGEALDHLAIVGAQVRESPAQMPAVAAVCRWQHQVDGGTGSGGG